MSVSTKHAGATLSSGTANVDTSGAVAIGSGLSASGSGGNIGISVGPGSGAGGAISADDATEASNDGEPASMVAGSLFTTGGDAKINVGAEATAGPWLVLSAWPVYTFHGRSNSKITLPFYN